VLSSVPITRVIRGSSLFQCFLAWSILCWHSLSCRNRWIET
jgi:hypothetical protein